MMYLEFNRIGRLIAGLSLCILCLVGCSKTEQNKEQILPSDLKQLYPQQLTKFDKVDSLYFSYLGVNSFPLSDGSFILAIREPNHLIHISKDGNSLLGITKDGRGPNELLDIGIPTRGNNSTIHVYDRNKNAVMIFDSLLSPINEFQILRNENLYVDIVYQIEGDKYLLQMSSIDWLFDLKKSKQLVFSLYDKSNKMYEGAIRLLDRQYAQSENPSPPAPTKYYAEYLGGDRAIPYSAKQLYAFSSGRKSLYLYNTGSDLIAEVDFKFDTLSTISVSFSTEEITSAEVDSIKKTVQEKEIFNNLVSRLPTLKTPIERMLIDYKNRFWLQSNLRGDYIKWIVMTQDGEIEKVVNLPKNSYLTHISEHHLGIRIDDSTFGLYEAIE